MALASLHKSFADLFLSVPLYRWIHTLPQVFPVILKNLSTVILKNLSTQCGNEVEYSIWR